MSAVTPTPGVATGDARLPWRSGPLLGAFAAAGVLTSADVRVAERLGALTGERDEGPLLAAALTVRAVRAGSVCLPLAQAHALVDVADPDASPADGAAAGTDDLPRADLVAALHWPDPAAWQDAVRRSPLVADGPDGPPDRPVRWVDGRVYLDRYWRDEQLVRHAVDARLADALPADDDAVRRAVTARFPDPRDDRQRLAAATAAVSRLTVLTGGPGTGKTTTVARLLAVLRDLHGPELRIALAAPTGRAAARLQESVEAHLAALADASGGARPRPLRASTLHRLLGSRPGGGTRFRHDRTHRLPHEVVVVDEASMVSLPLLARLLDALRPDARLVLVGDPDQLASVEVGAVLGDLVARVPAADAVAARLAGLVPADLPAPADPDTPALRAGVVRLTVPHRFGADLAALAEAVRGGRAGDVLALLRAGGPHVDLVETGAALATDTELARVRTDVVAAGTAVVDAARAGDAGAALAALGRHRLLLAHRRGPLGVARWAAVAQQWVDAAAGPAPGPGPSPGSLPPPGPRAPWAVGTPLLVTTNDRSTGLANGDTGVVVDDGAGGTLVAFGTPEAPRLVRTHRLPPVEPVHAMTVHRAQGSQYGRVTVLLPPASSPLLTRELLYTAVTRARDEVRVVGTAEAVRAAVERPVRRASGLRFAR